MAATATAIHASINERDLRAEVNAILAQAKAPSQATVAREAGISPSAFNQWLKNRYAGDNEGVELKIEQWIESYHARRAREKALPHAPDWVQTPTAERVIATLTYAQFAQDIVVIYGSAGVSKTASCLHYAATNPNVWLCTMTPASATVVPALEEVADAVGLSNLGTGAARIQRGVIKRLRDTYGLLIIDEAHNLGIQALDEIRALHDATGIGLALVGNEEVYARMTGGSRAAYLDRLYSRVGKKLHIRRSTQDDVDALIAAWGLKQKECISHCREIAAKPGGLRGLTKVLRLASMFAASARRSLCCADIRAAWRDLGGES